MGVTLDTHQLTAIRELKNGSILTGGVGSGKSRTAIAFYITKVCGGSIQVNGVGEYRPMRDPKDLYVVTTAKKRDSLEWEAEASNFALSTAGHENPNGTTLTIDSWNNIGKYEEITDAFFIFDEQRLVGSGAWVKSFLKIVKKNTWIILSATPGDNWTDYIPVFIANGFYKNRTAFLREHAVYRRSNAPYPVIDHFVEINRLERQRRQILIDMPMQRHTTRHVQNIVVDYDKKQFQRIWKDRWNIDEERPLRDAAEMFVVARRLVNTDPSRLAAVMELNEVHPRLIIFYNFDRELEMIRQLGHILDIEVAEWNGHKHQPVPTGNRWLYLVQYTAGAEGWNCITTDTVVFWSLNYSYKIFEQAKGRIDRMNTPFTDLHYYVLRSGSPVDNAVTNSLHRKETFNLERWAKESREAKLQL